MNDYAGGSCHFVLFSQLLLEQHLDGYLLK